ncbi:hypothetical protein VMCG_08392 [Cytospora schulzeri]|uniref:DUF3752 domain-containing protein n=1 Tax=Cytospora schulzeri TaxID=448051 RepID=A0A423VQS9_9PEZI|nr:hypothetical protein VMCG_08392 [Valsa malicola]
MSSIGPQLPPHLAKRKRSPEDDESADSPPTKTPKANQDEIALDGDDSDSDDGYGPSAPKPQSAAAPTNPSIGPTLPPSTAPASNSNEIALDSDDDDDDNTGPAPPAAATATVPPPTPAPRRVMGPALPPADLAERPPTDPHPDPDSDSDSEDDYGPALPGTTRPNTGPSLPSNFANATGPSEPARPRRDDWMLAPPTSSGYQERDPTKIKSRKFASGASATSRPKDGSAGGISSIWTETPEEKAKRLADAVLGRGSGVGDQPPAATAAKSKKAGGGSREQQDKIRAFTEQTRGRSLYDEHQSSRKSGKDAAKDASKDDGKGEDEEDDDPSKRAFDREKDMGLGMKITASQRKELLNRASDFGGRFQKGNFL